MCYMIVYRKNYEKINIEALQNGEFNKEFLSDTVKRDCFDDEGDAILYLNGEKNNLLNAKKSKNEKYFYKLELENLTKKEYLDLKNVTKTFILSECLTEVFEDIVFEEKPPSKLTLKKRSVSLTKLFSNSKEKRSVRFDEENIEFIEAPKIADKNPSENSEDSLISDDENDDISDEKTSLTISG